MNWIIDNWEMIVALISVVLCVTTCVITFIKEPNDKKIASVKEWLLYAVTEAEKMFGGGTGTLKLHYVWNLACQTFPWISKLITFDMFSEWVDEALEWLKIQLESNNSVKGYVEGEQND